MNVTKNREEIKNLSAAAICLALCILLSDLRYAHRRSIYMGDVRFSGFRNRAAEDHLTYCFDSCNSDSIEKTVYVKVFFQESLLTAKNISIRKFSSRYCKYFD
jgi:hypothetical protein